MAHKIIDQWQEGEQELRQVVYDYRLIYGIKSLMQGNEIARATFGIFEVQGRNVIHSTYNGDSGEYDDNFSVSEYLDDLADLRNGNVNFE